MTTPIVLPIPLLLLITVMVSYHGAAEASQDPPDSVRTRDLETIVDTSHALASRQVFTVARWVDRLFGSGFEAEEADYSFVRVKNATRWEDGDGWTYRPKFGVKARFPAISRRVHVFLYGDRESNRTGLFDLTDELAAGVTPPEEGDHSGFGGVNWKALEWLRLRTDVRAGLRSSYRPYTELRLRVDPFRHDRFYGRLTETLFWIEGSGFGESSRLELDYLLSRRRLLRWTNRATYSEISEGIAWGSVFEFFVTLNDRHSVLCSSGASGVTQPHAFVTDYRVSAKYRRDIYKAWLFAELEPSVAWPKALDQDRETITAASVALEIYVGRL